MKKQILLALFFSFTYLGLNAQCNVPFPPSLECDSAPVICSLDGYCTTSGGANSIDQPSSFCGSVQNNQWFSFVAGSTTISLDFIVGLCGGTTSGTGLQAQVYSVCGAPWTSASNCLYEISPNSTETLTMTGLTIGNVYYLMTDGFSGDICDYSIEVTGGSTTPPTPDPAGPISGDAQFCPGATSVTYCAAPSLYAAFYEWTIPAGATIVGDDDGACITIDFSGVIGTTGMITATPTNGCESGASSSFSVSQGPAPTTPDVDFVLCPGDTETYGNTVYSSAGSFLNTDIANAQGCLVETMVNVVVGQDVTTNLMEVICFGDVSSTGEGGTGFYTYNLLTSLGCDSTVILDLTVLNPQTGIFPVTDEIDCSFTPVAISAVVTNSDPSISYIWTGPCIEPGIPGNPNISVSCGGVYEVFATQTVGGVTCTSPTFPVTISENTTPPTADPGLGGVIGCGTGTLTLGGQGSSNTSSYIYSWTGPNAYSSTEQFPNNVTEAGTYCFFMIDQATSCMSTTECVTVTGDNTPPVAVASASNNLNCNNTTATLDPAGSDPAGTYTWSGQTGSNPTVSAPGTYTLTVTGANGCTTTQEVTITQDIATPTAMIAQPAGIDCNNSSVSLDGSGSGSDVTYLWSTGETTPMATTNNGPGTYTLTVTSTSNGCTNETTVMVVDNSTTVTADIDVSGQLTCSNGSVTLSAINVLGSSNPTYSWSNGMTGQMITVSDAGPITLTVEDATTGCNGDVMVNVTSDDTEPVAMADVSGQINCDNPSVVLSTAGSSTGGNITTSWSTPNPNNVTMSGVYTLTVTNTDNGCTATADVTVVQDIDAPVAVIAPVTAIDCNNMTTTIDGSSSTGANLSYAWSGQGTGTGPTLNATAAGTYTLTVTNMDNGCTATEQVVVDDNTTTVTVTASVSNEITCNQGMATLDVSGGTGSANPTYTWTGPMGGTGSTINVNMPGTYTLTVIDGNTGCEGSTMVTVVEDTSGPTALVAPANDLTCTTSSVTLDGSSSSTGNNITYQWFLGTTAVPSGMTEIIDVTLPGDYTLVVTDTDNGCTTTSSIVQVILDDATPTAAAVAGNNGLLSCSLSSLTIDGSSSMGNCLAYEWSNNGSVVGTDPTFEASNAGDYILVVTNCDNGCTDQTTVSITADAGLPTAVIAPVVNLDCNNSTSTLQGTGTSNTGGSVSVEWLFNGAPTGVTTLDYDTAQEGEYTFVVTDDGNGCSSSALVQLVEDMNPPMIDIAPSPVIDCINPMVTVNATNSASGTNIEYQWQSGGVDLPLEVNNTLITGDAGDYVLVVTNTDNGCTSTQMVTVPENIEAPVIDASALNNIDCNNMEASLTSSVVSSFSTDLDITWTLSGTQIGTGSDIQSANEGMVTVTYTDTQNGCSTSMDVMVQNTTQDPTVTVVASDNGALNCTITATTLDGTGSDTGANFNYEWTLDSDPTNVLSTDIMYSTEDPGNYILTVINTDNGCVSTIPVSVSQDIISPTSVAISNTATLTCTDPTITLDGSSSSIGANFTYQWYEIIAGTATEISGATDISYNVGVAGTYELIVTNTDNGCTSTSTQLAIDQSSDVPMAVISSDGILTCDNGDVLLDGLSSTGGTLEYVWLDSLGNTIDVGPELTVTTQGEITLNITDTNNGCTSSDIFFVDQDVDAPAISVNPGSTLTCAVPEYTLDGSTSTLDPNITYTYEWTAASDPTFMETTLTVPTVATPDTYTLLITNTQTGCTATEQVVIDDDFEAPTVMTSNSFTITCDPLAAAAPLTGTGSSANGNFTYQWMQGATVFSNQLDTVTTETGSYTLIVTNEDNGCSSISNALVVDIDADLPAVFVAPAQTITCNNNGEIILDGSASETGADIEYQWFQGANAVTGGDNAFLTITDPGEYTFQVSNMTTGCTDQVTFMVDADQTPPVAQAGAGGTLICGQNDFVLDAVLAGSSDGANYTYAWFDASNNLVGEEAVFAATAPGDFEVVVTNTNNGCSTTSLATTIVADSNSPVLLMDPSAPELNCNIQTITYDANASTVNPNSSGTLIYEWTDASGAPLGDTPTLNISDTNPVTLTITDAANNCSVSATYTAPQDIEEPSANAGPVQTLFCGTPNVTLDGSGSSANGAAFDYAWTGPNGETGNDATIVAAAAGTWSLLITNTENGCTSASTVLVDEDTNLPTAVVDFAGMLTCDVDEISVDGSASTTVSGSAVQYLWSNGSTSATTTFDAPGAYELIITDAANNCTATQVFNIEQDDLPPVADIQAFTSQTISCNEPSLVFNGSASNNNGNPNGGTLTYEWLLNNNTIVAPGTIDEVEISEDGNLALIVTNTNNGCSSTIELDVVENLNEPDATLPLMNPQLLDCETDEVTISATASTGTQITYQWTGPGTIINETTLTPTVSTTGTFTLLVTDTDNGCTTEITTQVDGNFNAPNAFATALDQFDCVTDQVSLDGSSSANGPNISYEWTTSTGVIESGANTVSPVVSAPGDYILAVLDSENGCSSTTVVTVSANTDVPTITGFQVIDPNCFGENNGSITLDNVTGGQLPYLYSIDGGALAPINQFSFLGAGQYDILVEDANGCTATELITITDPQELIVELGNYDPISLGDEFVLSAQIVGAYDTIMWSSNCPDSICANEPDGIVLTPLNTVTYDVTVVDGNGCITTDQVTINVEKERNVYIPNAFSPNGDGNNDHFWIFPGQEVAKVHEFRVFNRWGEQVFGVSNFDALSAQDEENGWDGTLNSQRLNPAVFVYYVDIEFIDGRREILKGDVALRR